MLGGPTVDKHYVVPDEWPKYRKKVWIVAVSAYALDGGEDNIYVWIKDRDQNTIKGVLCHYYDEISEATVWLSLPTAIRKKQWPPTISVSKDSLVSVLIA